ncbi:MAG: hypothetical protein VX693_06335 [Pseudomonadota bacterium]|nr:hypothetical protein [Pseudomonadota bacterium]
MARIRLHSLVSALTVLLMTLSLLSACGKKGNLQPPEGEKTDFPRKYPSY